MTELICRIGIFVLCAQVLVHFRPKPVYERYLRLLVSAMILAQLLSPVLDLWGGAESLEERIAAYSALLDEGLENAVQEGLETQKRLDERLGEELEDAGTDDAEAEAIRIEWEEVGEIKVD